MSKISSPRPNKRTKRPIIKPSVKNHPENKTGLYSVVYQSLLGKCCSFILLTAFMFQASYVAAAGVTEDLEPVVTDQSGPSEPISNSVIDDYNDNDELLQEVLPDSSPSQMAGDSAYDLVADDYVQDPEISRGSDEVLNESDEENDYTPNDASAPADGLGSSDFSLDAPGAVGEESTESEYGVEGQAAVSVVANDSSLLFNRNECTELASGSFYCYQVPKDALGDALFAAPDQDGDLEIFFIRNGVQQQITNNLVDDAAPFFDEVSNTIVWHRQIDDRYQIISYEISTGRESQITAGIVNNMEPVRQGQYIAWQRWIDNSWQIVLFDGLTEVVVSRNTDHNVAPNLNGDLLVWNRHTTTGQKTLEVYNVLSGSYFSLDDPDGLAVENPRMMLVYDTVQQNGELVTRGYDLSSGRFIDIDTRPRSLPSDIPRSEQTGETRALIQSKPGIKLFENTSEEEEETTDSTSYNPPADPYELDLRDIDPVNFDEAKDSIIIEDLVVPHFSELEEVVIGIEDSDSETVKEPN